MRSTEDLTARARIRDAALRRFAEHGVRATTIRAVAQDAGVAPGLVSHHFGSKDGLRDACDAYVLDYLRQEVKQAVDERRLEDPVFVADAYQTAPPVLRYLARALVERSAAAASLFDDLVAITEEFLAARPQPADAPHADPRAQAAVFTAMHLGVYVLHEHVSRALGTDALSREGAPRVGAALLDIVDTDFADPDLVDLARTGLDRFQHAEGDRHLEES